MPDNASVPLLADFDYCVEARRRSALTARQRRLMFGLLAAASLVVGLVVTVFGAWPVLPYSALEITVVLLAYLHVERRARDWERLTVLGDRVILERERSGRQETREFNRLWLRIELDERRSASLRTSQLSLRFAGEALEFGGDLPPGERARVARELRRLLAAR